jgi:RecA/RadA recombinase
MAKKSKKVVEQDDDDTPKKKKKKAEGFDYSSIYTDSIDVIARRQGFEASTLDVGDPMSTGMLTTDLQMGGGIRAGMYTSAGGEQSAKTTNVLKWMASAIKENIPRIELVDFEGSTKNSKPYVMSIIRGEGLKLTSDELFGKKDKETGKWITRPRVTYHSESVGEKFFDYMSEVLRALPDKKFIAGQWWLVFEETKSNKTKYSEYSDPNMPKKYGKGIWIPAPDGKLQAIFFVDSYPAMNSIANDEEDANNGLALQARMFSKHLPRVKGRMAEKMVALIGVNQLRAVPMAMFGPKENEPGGTALKFNSDVRIRNTSRGSGYPLWAKDFNKKFEEVEKSVEVDGGIDRYRYIHTKAIKNKLWTPGRENWIRIWIEDGKGVARGLDPFFDTMYYLKLTGQLIGKGRNPSKTGSGGLTLNLEGLGKGKAIKWAEYKKWILGDKETMKEMSKKAGFKPMSLRAFCFKQMSKGVSETLYLKAKDSTIEESEE